MIPDIGLELQSILRSMKDAVIPAIDPANEVAMEQASLICRYVDGMMHRVDQLYDFELIELRRVAQLNADLLSSPASVNIPPAIAAQTREEITEAQAIGALGIPPLKQLASLTKSMKETADLLIDGSFKSSDAHARRVVSDMVLEYTKYEIEERKQYLFQR